MLSGATQATEISGGRRLAAAAALAATGGITTYEALRHHGPEWLTLAFAGILGLASFGITRRSMVLQVLSRGAAWICFAPAALMTVTIAANHGHLQPDVVAFAVTSGAALLLGRPMLHTASAKAEFAPRTFRSLLLAGSTATIATAYLTGGVALDALNGSFSTAAGFGLLTISMLASAIAVVRMRAWGIFLGGLTSLLVLLSALVIRGGEGVALAIIASPALALHVLPILLARQRGSAAGKVRVAPESAYEPALYAATARVRVASEPDHDDRDEDEPRAELRRAASSLQA